MLDDEYDPQQIANYGARAQPALVARMTPQLRMTQAGLGVAILAVASCVGAIYTFPSFGGGADGSGFAGSTDGSTWAVGALIASVVLLAICSFQHVAWQRAMAEWKGERDSNLDPWRKASWVAHVLSYVVVLFALWTCIAGSLAAGTNATAAAMLAFALLFMVVAQVLAGVQYLRICGPPGTIPAHLRRLNVEIQRRR